MENTESIKKKEMSLVSKIIVETIGLEFKPNKTFYSQVKINQKRFGLLKIGKKSPTVDELKSLCLYFNVEISEYVK